MFKNKVCVITGGANGIGKAIVNEFIKNNAKCYIIDIVEGDHFIGDISDKNTLERFVKYVIDKEGYMKNGHIGTLKSALLLIVMKHNSS